MLNQHHIVLFVLIPMFTGLITLLTHGHRTTQRIIGFVCLGLNLAVAIWALHTVYNGPNPILVSQMGNWPAPFGISIVIDCFSALMLVFSAVVCIAVYCYCIFQLRDRFSGGFFLPLFHFLLMGVQWSFITGDLFNLFVAFEIMLMCSYSMFTLGTTKAQMKQAYKYVLLNLIGSTLFVTCAGLLYGQLGTLNIADITRMASQDKIPDNAIPVICMLFLVFGGKTAIFPLWYWLPDTYHTLPSPIGGLFAGLLTKVGAYVMIRIFVMTFGQSQAVSEVLTPIVLLSAIITMFLGVLGAVSMHSVRRILSIHIISQVGYMLMGIGLAMYYVAQPTQEQISGKEWAIAGAIFFIIHNMVVKCCLFLCAGLIKRNAGSDDLTKIGGLAKRIPFVATLFLIAALSLAGLPPLSGFFGKWLLIREGWAQEKYWLTAFAIATSLLTLLSMLKIWSYGFWSPPQGFYTRYPSARSKTAGGVVAVTFLVAIALSMGFASQQYLNICHKAAQTIINPKPYVIAVLGQKYSQPQIQPNTQPHTQTHQTTFKSKSNKGINTQ